MTDENNNIDEAADGGSDEPVAGERLAEARREQQIPVIEIAKELHLDEYKVRALECNDFDVIGAPVFAKGHLRKYAQLVKVDEADVMADYYRLDRSAGAPPVITTRRRPRQVMALGPWIAVIVVILVAATGYWWFAVREPATERPAVGQLAPLPQDEVDTAVDEGVVDDAAEEAVDEPETIEAATPDPEPVVISSPVNNETRISITYLGDCWTEISDAGGRRLFFDLGKEGRTVNLSGEAPFNVLFGDVANVSIELDGERFEIQAADRRGRTARLTINGS
jgi:cytoskeleton protein RodZ